VASQPAPGELEVVRGFVNTWDAEDRTEALGTPDALVAWLEGAGLLSGPPEGSEARMSGAAVCDIENGAFGLRASEADLARARHLREALRAMLRHHHGDDLDPAAVDTVEEAARRARLAVRFGGAEGTARVEPLAGGVDGALGQVLARVADAMRDGTWVRLKVCPADDCQVAFYDTSRNRSAVWCEMKVCGNREKVRSYRRRRSAPQD
jgi:predicted RNA-binding Zn ribbon-like protein